MLKTKSQTRTVTVHGWEGHGASIAEAKADAVAKIERAIQGEWMPVTVRYRGMVGICWREPWGWSYTIDRPGSDHGPTSAYFSSGYDTDRASAVRSMLWHVAQNGFVPGEDPTAPDIIADDHGRREYETWARWQNAFKAHRDAHPDATADECRAFANQSH